jgi:hypothetical protein
VAISSVAIAEPGIAWRERIELERSARQPLRTIGKALTA